MCNCRALDCIPAWASLVKVCLSAVSMQIETSVWSDFSIWKQSQQKIQLDESWLLRIKHIWSKLWFTSFLTWSPKPLAVIPAWRTLSIVAVPCSMVTQQAILGVGVSRTDSREAGAIFCQVAVSCFRSADAACWFQLRSGEEHRWWCTDY